MRSLFFHYQVVAWSEELAPQRFFAPDVPGRELHGSLRITLSRASHIRHMANVHLGCNVGFTNILWLQMGT